MAPPLSGLTVVIPAHNEEGNVGRAVTAAAAAAASVAEKVEVIVVDDGSTDRTGDEAQKAGAEVISHPGNEGYGAALRTGFALAATPWIFLLDADHQFDPHQLDDLVAYAEMADMEVRYRAARADG